MTINDKKLLDLIDREKVSQSEAARQLGVSRQAISQRIILLRGKVTKVQVMKPIGDVIAHKLQTMEQLSKVNDYANEMLDLLMAWARGDPGALQVLESSEIQRKIRMGTDEDGKPILKSITEWKIKDPRELALKAMAEIRNQLKLQFDMFQTMYSIQAAEEFQKTVLETIRKVAPDVRDEIIRALHRERSIRQAVTID